jgi:hypothetical protein
MAALILPISTSAASTTVTFNLAGTEYASTFAQSSFAGAAVSTSRTEYGVWNAVVDRDLGAIVGGTFRFESRVRTFNSAVVGGTFTARPGGGCAKTTFDVAGVLSSGGSFGVTLTRYGFMTGGRCVVYFAPARGTATLTF